MVHGASARWDRSPFPLPTLGARRFGNGDDDRPEEAEHFGRMAADWWDPDGSSAMLKLNPVRLAYIRDRIISIGGSTSTISGR